ncbi:MAG: heparin lyase I family protein [Kofleriaceae bacterium]
MACAALLAGCAEEEDADLDLDDPSEIEWVPNQSTAELAAAATVAPRAVCSERRATLRTVEAFESFPFSAFKMHTYPASTVTRSSRFARKGRSSMRATVGDPELTPTQCTQRRYRGELQANDLNIPWDDGVSHWWGMSFNPTKFPGDAYSLLQLHAPIPYVKACDYDGNSISLVPRRVNGVMSYQLGILERGGRSEAKGAGSNTRLVWSEPMKLNAWSDFVFNFTLSSKGQGYVHVWRNGQLIYSRTGLTNVNHTDSCGKPVPPEKRASKGPSVGIYGPSCRANATPSPHFRELYVDEVRTARGPSGYGLVAPECQ